MGILSQIDVLYMNIPRLNILLQIDVLYLGILGLSSVTPNRCTLYVSTDPSDRFSISEKFSVLLGV